MRNILVLGGTGVIGSYFVQLITENDNNIKAYVTSRYERQSSVNIEYIRGDAKDNDFLAQLLAKKWDAIVDFMVYSTPIFKQRIFKFLDSTDQYVFISSARVYADSENPLNESSARLVDSSTDLKFLATDEYSLAKARQEDILTTSDRKNWTIVRPYITYSEQRLQLGVLEKEEWLYRALKGRTIIFSTEIASKFTTMTHGYDVAKAILAIIMSSKSLGKTFQVTQNRSITWSNVLENYLVVLEKYTAKRPKVIFLGLNEFSQCKKAQYQIKYDRMLNRRFDSSMIGELVHVDEFMPITKGISSSLELFLRNPKFLNIDWRSEAIKDRFSGDVAKLTEFKNWKQMLKYFFYRFLKS